MKTIARITGLILLLCGTAIAPHGTGLAQSGQPPPRTQEDGVAWFHLSSQQRADLAPLQPQWRDFSGATKEKWLAVSTRMSAMRPVERERIQSRMSSWANLSPVERGQTRLQFSAARRVSPDTRAEQWKRYNELSEEERRQLAARAVPPVATRSVTAVRYSKPFLSGEPRSAGKANTTPVAPSALPQGVTPSVIQAQRGATTSLISARPLPPPHQPAGQPKIAPAHTPTAMPAAMPAAMPTAKATPIAAPKPQLPPEPGMQPPPNVAVPSVEFDSRP